MTLDTPEKVIALAQKLSNVPLVARYDIEGEAQGSVLAHAITDIEQSCISIVSVIIPLLNASNDPVEIGDALNDLRDELRHIFYHARDARYFAYLFDQNS